jgi:urea ABC transporter ATP-binding protein UrtE
MLKVVNLQSGYGRIPVLMGIDFSVAEGEFVGILGHNGMGKTTLLKTLIGILPATAGEIVLGGDNLIRSAPHHRARRGIGYVPQGRGILSSLSVLDNLRFAAVAVGKERSGAIDEVLESFPRLHRLLDRRGGALSGGEQQLLALARTLIQNPRIVLLDEPTEGIQPSIIEEIIEQLKLIRARRGLTVLLVEQNVDFIRELSDRVLLIQKGLIVKEFPAAALTDSAAMGNF